MKTNHLFSALALSLLVLAGCSPKHYPNQAAQTGNGQPIVIFYDNDVHCAVDGYAVSAALKKEALQTNPNVLLVSAGDYVQGGSLGAASKGGYIVSIMNQADYDVVTLGNHEFDYGMPRMDEITKGLNASVSACNLFDLRSGKKERMFPEYVMKTFGSVDVAVIGIATPYSFVSSTPSYFQNEKGEYVYSLSSDDFFSTVQKTIDKARKDGAEYVIALTHLGDDILDEINALTMIMNTTGLDAVLDGHSHSTIPGNMVADKKGHRVLHTSTGSHFEAVGKLTIDPSAKDALRSELIPVNEQSPRDAKVDEVIKGVKAEYAAQGSRVVGRSEKPLIAADETHPRIARIKETGLGNFCVDAYRMRMHTDIAALGGGSVRAALPEGVITYNDIFTLFPFNNTVGIAEMSGQMVLDMLEFSVYVSPVEFGGFLQVSGLKFDVDLNVGSQVLVDANKMFVGFDGPERRVKNVMVLGEDGSYAPIDVNKVYTVAGSTYLLKEYGDGYAVLKGAKVTDLGMLDLQLLEDFISETLGGVIPASYEKPEGRINFIK